MQNRHFLLLLHVGSLILLGFGWFLNMLYIKIDFSNSFLIDFKYNLFNEKRSVVGTLQTLWEGGNYWPFLLILLFGIIVPIIKSAIIFYLLLIKDPPLKWYNFVNAISKWAMADVFAISIFVAFLGAGAMQNTQAILEPGFYYFAGYVVLSGVISMVLGRWIKNQHSLQP